MSAAMTDGAADVQWSDDGYVTISGPLLEWANELDAVYRGWAAESKGTEFRFPSMISARSLAPIAYLKSFPHLATFVTSGDRREESLRSIAENFGTSEQIDLCEERMEPVSQLLTPAACYHFYPRFAGQRLPEPIYLTTKCQCHRREEEYLPLQRQWCFEMREVVCLGDADAIDAFTEEYAARVDALKASLGLTAEWHVATDPFFDPGADPKALAQILEPVKKELCTEDGLAIGSVNKHRSFFGECYDIRVAGEPAQSACVAFGIERWLYAMLQAHGDDVVNWPAADNGQ